MGHTKQYNKVWWIEDCNPIFYNGMICWPTSIALIRPKKWRLTLTSPGVNDNAQFEAFVDLKDIKLVIA